MKFKIDASAVQRISASAQWLHCDLFEISVSEDGVVSFGPCVEKGSGSL